METADHEDHTFSGVMFDVKCIDSLPIEFLEITSVAVRGGMGPMTVWSTPDTYQGKFEREESQRHWTKLYEQTHPRSLRELVPLELDKPVQLKPGEGCGLFVHSSKSGDSAVVYDNTRHFQQNRSDSLLSILPGMAALDCRPFGQSGMWGEGWRRRREFVGRLGVGVCWRLWNPEVNQSFPPRFRAAVHCLLLCAARPGVSLHCLSDSVIFYILNMCRWDWFNDALQADAQPADDVDMERRRGPQVGTLAARVQDAQMRHNEVWDPAIWTPMGFDSSSSEEDEDYFSR